MKQEQPPNRNNLLRSPSQSALSRSITPSSSLRHQSKETIDKLASQSLANTKRKHTSSLANSPSRKLSRYDTFSSDNDTGSSNRWTKQHWRKLELYYLRKGRDVQKTANAFYYGESLKTISLPSVDDMTGRPVTDELWSKDQVIWRTNCLHTSVKFHNGLLPSQRTSRTKRRTTSTNVSATNTPSRSSSTRSLA